MAIRISWLLETPIVAACSLSAISSGSDARKLRGGFRFLFTIGWTDFWDRDQGLTRPQNCSAIISGQDSELSIGIGSLRSFLRNLTNRWIQQDINLIP